mmetsp:Transcript_9928/g.22087  ORF Transcript_9928/g.22087 Transcript_9928/m.22087 type:complete len:277 (+) Transcript_9928:278-1108(+)|eukprot:CAMPEP_0173227544 /NCGR_PEP_ID=MMETSP1142-20121109/6021_1 /TAXON_ID=483371 /ORGANISM="non described non described, Strain CCMP2298" /LENGTH=276 /DNA_ID=CAMNT_0014156069 /DNA_START=275 /DNA_END=1105 /DNA_ORIENTATION=-
MYLDELGHRLLGKEVGVLLLGRGGEVGGGPQLRGQEGGGLGECVVHSHGQVTPRAGVTSSGRVHVLDTSHGEQLLGDQRGHDAGPAGGGDEAAAHGTALAGHLAGHGVGQAGVEAPVSTPDGHEVHLGVDNASADGGGDLLGSLEAQAQVAVAVTHSHVALEARALASSGLLLHRHDLHHLVLERGAQQVVHDLELLDGQGEQEDLLDGADLALLHESAQLGDRDPLLLVLLPAPAPTPAPTATAIAATVTAATAAASAESSSVASGCRCVSHDSK